MALEATGRSCCSQRLNSTTSHPHSEFMDLDLCSDETHMSCTWSTFLSCSYPFLRMKPNPADPPLKLSLPMMSGASAPN